MFVACSDDEVMPLTILLPVSACVCLSVVVIVVVIWRHCCVAKSSPNVDHVTCCREYQTACENKLKASLLYRVPI